MPAAMKTNGLTEGVGSERNSSRMSRDGHNSNSYANRAPDEGGLRRQPRTS